MGESDKTAASPPSPEQTTIALSNGIRLTGREWLGLAVFAIVIVVFAPSLWRRAPA